MVGAGVLVDWQAGTRLGARSKFKLSAGSKRFALISTKMHRSPSLSFYIYMYLSLKRIPFFWSVLPSLSLTSFRQSQIIHFAASKCINILPVALIRLSPSFILLLLLIVCLWPIDLVFNCLLIVAIVFRISLGKDAPLPVLS